MNGGRLVVVPKEFYPAVTRQHVWAQELRGHPDRVPDAGQTHSPRLASSQANRRDGDQDFSTRGPRTLRRRSYKRHPCSSAPISLPSGLRRGFHNSADGG